MKCSHLKLMATIEYSHTQGCIFVVITIHDVVILIKLLLMFRNHSNFLCCTLLIWLNLIN